MGFLVGGGGIITRFLKNATTLQVFLWLQIVSSFGSSHMSVFDNELEKSEWIKTIYHKTVKIGLHLPPGKKETLEYLCPGVSEENCGHWPPWSCLRMRPRSQMRLL